MELSIGCVRRLAGAFANRTRKVDFFLSNHRRFRFKFLGHALGLDHHAVLLIFCANLLKQAKTEGFFWQRELRKTDTAREVCVGLAAQIDAVTTSELGRRIFCNSKFKLCMTIRLDYYSVTNPWFEIQAQSSLLSGKTSRGQHGFHFRPVEEGFPGQRSTTKAVPRRKCDFACLHELKVRRLKVFLSNFSTCLHYSFAYINGWPLFGRPEISGMRNAPLKLHMSQRKQLRQDPLDLSFWSFLTFLHHGIEEVERHLLWKFYKKIRRKSWSNVPPKLLACIGFLYKVVHKIGRLRKFNRSREIEFNFFTAWTISMKFGTLVQHASGYKFLPQIF